MYWKQLNGELISIDEMDIQHLRNTLKMVIRNNTKKLIDNEINKFNSDMTNEFNNIYIDGEFEEFNDLSESINISNNKLEHY